MHISLVFQITVRDLTRDKVGMILITEISVRYSTYKFSLWRLKYGKFVHFIQNESNECVRLFRRVGSST